MKILFPALTGLFLACAAPVCAQTQPIVVVELFTSQGCSSCPPADELLGELAQEERVLALSLHVDYWDYLGWKDRFAQPKFTERQRAYATFISDRMIYTPQIIVGGQDRMIGSRAAEVMAAVLEQSTKPGLITLTLHKDGAQVKIGATAQKLTRPVIVQVVRFTPKEDVQIRKGENGGRTITYHNVVKSWQQVGRWDGAGPLAIVTDAKGDASLAVILQEEGPGKILAAARLR